MTKEEPSQIVEMPARRPYQRRLFRHLGLWREGDWRLKAYGIHHDTARRADTVIDPDIALAARGQVGSHLQAAEREGNHHRTGFVIIHQALFSNWLQLNWWAYDDICCQALARATLERPNTFEPYDGPAMACVWELVVIDFERRAWIEHGLCNGGSIEAYLAAHLRDGLY